jgi:hypothetical protein
VQAPTSNAYYVDEQGYKNLTKESFYESSLDHTQNVSNQNFYVKTQLVKFSNNRVKKVSVKQKGPLFASPNIFKTNENVTSIENDKSEESLHNTARTKREYL